MKLSERLETILSFIPEGISSLIDIGTDHGYVPLFALERKLVKKATGIDDKEGPLQKLQDNLESFPHFKKPDFFISDGFSRVTEKYDLAVMAGIGVYTIEEILKKGFIKNVVPKFLIIEGRGTYENLFPFLKEHQYSLIKAQLVLENGKFYYVYLFTNETVSELLLDECELEFGPLSLNSVNISMRPTLNSYLNFIKLPFEMITMMVPNEDIKAEALEKIRYLESKMED